MLQQDSSAVSVSVATSATAVTSAATSVPASSLENKTEESTNSQQLTQTEKVDGEISKAEEGKDEGTDAHLLNK